MSSVAVTTPHDVSPETAIGAILEHGGPVLLDLDETLYLRNSTEDFIDSARPRLLALLLMRLLDVVKPWRWTGGEATRDVWRVRLICTCFPWTAGRWKNRVTGLARSFTNLRLMEALKTSGHNARSSPPPASSRSSRRWWRRSACRRCRSSPRACRPSPTAATESFISSVDALGDDTVRRALVLTDSAQDLTLLDACARPLRTVWPEARHHHALSGVYLPGQYLTHVKRPGARYIVRGILQEDFALLGAELGSTGGAAAAARARSAVPAGVVLGDLRTRLRRQRSDRRAPRGRPEAQRGIPGVPGGHTALATVDLGACLRRDRHRSAALAGDSGAQRTSSRGRRCCWPPTAGSAMYNRFDKGTRVWMFAGLQFARSAAFVALVPIGLIGAVALGAHVLAKWVPYYVYRLGGKEWPEAPLSLDTA